MFYPEASPWRKETIRDKNETSTGNKDLSSDIFTSNRVSEKMKTVGVSASIGASILGGVAHGLGSQCQCCARDKSSWRADANCITICLSGPGRTGKLIKCIVLRCWESKAVWSHIIPQKGADEEQYVAKLIVKDLEWFGYFKLYLINSLCVFLLFFCAMFSFRENSRK